MNYFVTGIGTDIGKTVVSAVLVEAIGADYWKPVQCGLPRDTEIVSRLVENSGCKFHPETFLLDEPSSPHQAASNQGISIQLSDISLPKTKNDLVIEGAGGIMVPLNEQEFMLDVIMKFSDSVLLVANLYLGSINHTLLSLDILLKHHIRIKGIVFNGPSNPHSESVILSYSGSQCLLHLEPVNVIESKNIKKWAQTLRTNMQNLF